MFEWLVMATESYFADHKKEHFSPFELFFYDAQTDAEAIAAGVASLSPPGKIRFKKALAAFVNTIPPRASELWTFVAELVWRTDAFPALNEIEKRFNDAFLDEMIAAAPQQFDVILGFLMNANFSESAPLVRLLRRAVSSSRFNDAYARLTLLRLCEIDPDHWTAHLAVTRDKLHAQMTRIRLTKGEPAMRAAQDELAEGLYQAVGFDRFLNGTCLTGC